MKIAIQLDNDRNIIGTVTTNELGAELQVKLFKDKGWTLVDGDPAFSSAESYLWTVRESDNKLVHISTGLTPDEEAKASLAELTKGSLANQMTGVQLQTAVTELTKQVVDLTVKLDKANGAESVPETPTDVTSTATNDGATITAK